MLLNQQHFLRPYLFAYPTHYEMFRFILGSFLVHNKSGSGSKGREKKEQAEKWAKICIWGQSESEAAPTAAAAAVLLYTVWPY